MVRRASAEAKKSKAPESQKTRHQYIVSSDAACTSTKSKFCKCNFKSVAGIRIGKRTCGTELEKAAFQGAEEVQISTPRKS
jgi:hypothetical protein